MSESSYQTQLNQIFNPYIHADSPFNISETVRKNSRQFRAECGSMPARKVLAQRMGCANDESDKRVLRIAVREFICRYLGPDFWAFREYDYAVVLYSLIKMTWQYMNREHLHGRTEWTRETTHHVVHSVMGDNRRNERSKEKAAKKRADKRRARRLANTAAGSAVKASSTSRKTPAISPPAPFSPSPAVSAMPCGTNCCPSPVAAAISPPAPPCSSPAASVMPASASASPSLPLTALDVPSQEVFSASAVTAPIVPCPSPAACNIPAATTPRSSPLAASTLPPPSSSHLSPAVSVASPQVAPYPSSPTTLSSSTVELASSLLTSTTSSGMIQPLSSAPIPNSYDAHASPPLEHNKDVYQSLFRYS
ncbi:hypothetical protein FN846DRAFT_888491 [Sphaerosporella brunnea]|uniref:Uncharacterized protein n=1 Tax=Sphaerosporella brunnea TaxID=1250544 RepID=A0A5J5F3H1_9PEZI|nr:hypothetical protein FN846DRAFT_888491 [Sphaerosporella brunnea]